QKADAAVEKALLDLGFTRIYAPIPGKISRALVTVGNLVNAGGGGTLLTTIVSVDPIYVYFSVDERPLQLSQKRNPPPKNGGSTARAKSARIPFRFGLDTDEGLPHSGSLDFAENKIDPSTGTIQVRGVVENKDGKFTPGSRVRVRVP